MKHNYLIFYRNRHTGETGRFDTTYKKIKDMKVFLEFEEIVSETLKKGPVIIEGCLDMGIAWK